MNKIIVFACLTFLAASAYAQHNTLTVIVKNIHDDGGTIDAALFNSENDFLKKEFLTSKVKASKGQVSLVFKNVPPGTYALSVRHDANSNGELDRNMVGIPKEPFGFSNDAMGTFGAPSFEKAGFVVKKSESIIVNLKYY